MLGLHRGAFTVSGQPVMARLALRMDGLGPAEETAPVRVRQPRAMAHEQEDSLHAQRRQHRPRVLVAHHGLVRPRPENYRLRGRPVAMQVQDAIPLAGQQLLDPGPLRP